MKTLRTHLVLAVSMVWLAAAAIVMPHSAQASLMKTYTYTGNTFTVVGGNFESVSPPGSFTEDDSVSVSFTVDCGSAGGTFDCASLEFADYSPAVTRFGD